jgi:hypothetical protein
MMFIHMHKIGKHPNPALKRDGRYRALPCHSFTLDGQKDER